MASDALFVLACGCILDGCSDSDPGLKWSAGVRSGLLHCSAHRRPELLIQVVGGDAP